MQLQAVALAFAATFVVSVTSSDSPQIDVRFTCGNDEKSCHVILGETFNLTIQQKEKSSVVRYNIKYSVGDTSCDEPKKNGYFLFPPIPPQLLEGTATKVIVVDTAKGNNTAGEVRIALNASGLDSKHVVDVTITRTSWLKTFGTVVGWIYFVAWSISFYPQCWINFKRKSVIGLNFDFVALNLTGFSCYAIYTLCLYYNPRVRSDYYDKHPLGVIQVEPNDIFFALHAIVLTLIIIIQCFIYERGGQSTSRVCRALLFAMFLFALVSLIVTAAGAKGVTWLLFVTFLSYIKLFITIIKYIPQAYMNFKRKSTDGWSIGNILLDFTGGSLSILQMFLKSYDYDDWMSIFGNVTKFGLGLFSVLFDILFILQHYVFYRHSTPYDEIINGNRVRSV